MISNLQSEFEDSTDINFTLINGLKAKSSGVLNICTIPNI